MHEYFWGQYNAEFYHEFCYKDLLNDTVSLGLFGSPVIENEYYMRLGSGQFKR